MHSTMPFATNAPFTPSRRSPWRVFASGLVALGVAACASSAEGVPSSTQAGPDPNTASGEVEVDAVEIVHGVPDKGRDPAVIAIDVAGIGLCSGTLIASNVVLTARHCVSETTESVQCPSHRPQVTGQRDPGSLAILSGDDVATAHEVARGVEVLVPKSQELCDNDIAAIVLDQDVDLDPVVVGKGGVIGGMRVRAVGYGKKGDGGSAGKKLLRDHVQVLEASAAEFLVGESTCQGDSGGPALDESGELVGVVSRGGPQCDGKGAHNIYTRADAFSNLVSDALKAGLSAHKASADAGTHRGGKSGKPASDMGEPCSNASECSTGVCVKQSGKGYCSRECGSKDRCPAHYKCEHPKASKAVCVAK